MSKADIAALLAAAKRPERTVSLCLRGDLQAAMEDLERDYAAALESSLNKLADGTAAVIAQQISDLREQMQDSTVVFRLRALTRKAWNDLVNQYKPAAGDEAGQRLGYDVERFFPALIAESTVEPELDAGQWEALLDETLTSRQYEELADAAFELNRRPVDVPFSFAASRTPRNSGEK